MLRLDQHSILTEPSIDATQTATTGTDPNDGYGIGWRIIRDNKGYRTVSHDGGMGGVRTRLMLVPEARLAIAVLCNASNSLPIEIAESILARCLPDDTNEPETPAKNDVLNEAPPFAPHPALQGEWSGKVHTYSGDVPVQMTIPKTGPILVGFRDGLLTVLNDPKFESDTLKGSTLGDIETSEAAKRPYTLAFDLNLRWNVLNGSVTAVSKPGLKLGNALSHWCELEKTS
jgi:hypothetical protein